MMPQLARSLVALLTRFPGRAAIATFAVAAGTISTMTAAPLWSDALLSILVIVALVSLVTTAAYHGDERVAAPVDAFDLTALAIGFASVAWIFATPGVPALRHDWDFQDDPATFANSLWSSLAAWNVDNLGAPSFRAGVFPWVLAVGVLGRVTSPAFALATSFALTFGTAFWATRRLVARVTACDPLAAVFIALFYAAAPPFVERVVAGHYMHVYFAALYPLTMLVGSRIAARRGLDAITDVAIAIALVGTVSQQPFAFVIAGATLILAIGPLRRPCTVAVVAIALLALISPQIVAAVLTPADGYALARAVTVYEVAQSSPPQLLIHLAGSIGRYWDAVSNPISDASIASIVVASAFGVRRLRTLGRAAYVAGCIAALAMLGAYGLLAGPELAAFGSFSILSIVRELYDLAPLVALAAALGFAAWFGRPRRFARVQQSAVALLVMVSTVPTLSNGTSRLVPHVVDADVEQGIGRLPGTDRILWLPGMPPMRDGRHLGSGDEPTFRTTGGHEGVWASTPSDAVQRAYWLLDRDPAAVAGWLRRLGCGWIGFDRRVLPLRRDGPVVTRMIANALRVRVGAVVHLSPNVDAVRLAAPEAAVSAPAVRVTSDLPIFWNDLGADLLTADPVNDEAMPGVGLPRAVWTAFAPSTTVADPALGLVSSANHWRRFPEASYLPGLAVVTRRRPVALSTGTATIWWSGNAVGLGRVSSAPVHIPHTGALDFPGNVALVAERSGTSRRVSRIVSTSARTAFRRLGPTEYELTAKDDVRSIVLRTTFASGWEVTGGASRPIHFRADGWANAWLVRAKAGTTLRIFYAPERLVATFERIPAVLYIALGFAALFGTRSARLMWEQSCDRRRNQRSPAAP